MPRIRPRLAALLAALLLVSGPAMADQVINLLPPGGGGVGVDVETRPVENGLVHPLSGGGNQHSSDSHDPPAFDPQPSLQTRHFGRQASLSCQVAGTPGALVLINAGDDPLPSGTRIKWQLKGAGLFGYFALVNELGGGESLVADDVIAGSPDRGTECLARVI